jgi:hypothetical protein
VGRVADAVPVGPGDAVPVAVAVGAAVDDTDVVGDAEVLPALGALD